MFCYCDKSRPWPCFLTDQICFIYFCRGSPSDNLCQILFNLTIGFREDVLSFLINGNWPHSLVVMILDGSNSIFYVCKRSFSDHFYQNTIGL